MTSSDPPGIPTTLTQLTEDETGEDRLSASSQPEPLKAVRVINSVFHAHDVFTLT